MDSAANEPGMSDWPAHTVSQFDGVLLYVDSKPSSLFTLAGELLKTPAYRARHLLQQANRDINTPRHFEYSQRALEIAKTLDDPVLLADAWLGLSNVNNLNVSLASIREALRLYGVVGDRNREAVCQLRLARTFESMGQHPQMLVALKKAATLLQSDGNARLLMLCYTEMAAASLWVGDVRQATEALDLATELFPLVGTSLGFDQVVWGKVLVAEARGDVDGVQQYLGEYRCIQADVRHDLHHVAFANGHIAQLLSRIGETVRARNLLDAASKTADLDAYHWIVLRSFDADLYQYEGDYALARAEAAKLRIWADRHGSHEALSQYLARMGDIALAEADGHPDRREELAHEALLAYIPELLLATRSGQVPRIVEMVAALGRTFLAMRDYETAQILLTWHVTWARRSGLCQFLPQSLVALAELCDETDTLSAVRHSAWDTASVEVSKSRTAHLRAKCDRRVGQLPPPSVSPPVRAQ